jgi:hypothetical protein
MTNASTDPTDWLAYLEATPHMEPYLSIAKAWRADRAEIEQLTRERNDYKVWWERDSTSLGKALNEVSSLRASNEQLRGNLSLAEEGLANYALEVERLKAALRLLDNGFKYSADVCNIARGALAQSAHEPLPVDPLASVDCWLESYCGLVHPQAQKALRDIIDAGASRDLSASESASFHKTLARSPRIIPQAAPQEINSIDDVAAICHSVTGLCCHILGSPGGPCTIGNCAAVRGYLGGPEFAVGASRDASSDEFPECRDEPRDCPYVYCHSQLKCAKAPASRT